MYPFTILQMVRAKSSEKSIMKMFPHGVKLELAQGIKQRGELMSQSLDNSNKNSMYQKKIISNQIRKSAVFWVLKVCRAA